MIYSAPSHLAGLVMEANKNSLAKIQKEYGDCTTAFQFSIRFQSLVLSFNEETGEYGGRVWAVEPMGKRLLVFDQFKHGYNGAMNLNEEDDISSTKIIDLSEAEDLVIAFQYNGDEAEYIEEGISKLEQDYFGWFAIYKQMENRIAEIISFECA